MRAAESRFFVGLDLGQAHDYSALAVVERVAVQGEWDATRFSHTVTYALRLRHVERIRLGTTYPDVVTRASAVTQSGELSGRCQLMVDATGVGRPVVDLLRRARVQCSILPAVITCGTSETLSKGYYHVPKSDLVAGVQVALQTGALQIATGMKWIPSLLEEMAGMRVRVSSDGHESFGASRNGTHDDLVVALALSLWGARKAFPRSLGGEPGSLAGEESWRGGG